MNNMKVLIALMLTSLLSCKEGNKKNEPISNLTNSKENIDSALILDKKLISSNLKESRQIKPDTTINNKLLLSNSESLINFYSSEIKTVDRIRESPVVIFTSRNKNEYLIAYQYEGSSKNSFDCFEIGYYKNEKSLIEIEKYETSETKFETESKICLGADFKKIVEVKGSNYNKLEKENSIVITYRNDDYANSSFLKRYNMPSYYMEFTIERDKVIKIKFGFDYP